MTEKVCQLYEEEQLGKIREGRKAVPTNKMPDLGWDIAETLAVEENIKENRATLVLQIVITITIIIAAIRLITTHLGKLSRVMKKAIQKTREISRNTCTQNIKDFYKTAALVITIATNKTDRTSRNKMNSNNDRNNYNNTDPWKPNDKYDYSYQSHSPRSSDNSNN